MGLNPIARTVDRCPFRVAEKRAARARQIPIHDGSQTSVVLKCIESRLNERNLAPPCKPINCGPVGPPSDES